LLFNKSLNKGKISGFKKRRRKFPFVSKTWKWKKSERRENKRRHEKEERKILDFLKLQQNPTGVKYCNYLHKSNLLSNVLFLTKLVACCPNI
jgi:hypothetical protein